jgi:hypothetical protein
MTKVTFNIPGYPYPIKVNTIASADETIKNNESYESYNGGNKEKETFDDIVNKILKKSYFDFFTEQINIISKYVHSLINAKMPGKNMRIKIMNNNDIKKNIKIDYEQPDVSVTLDGGIKLIFDNVEDSYEFRRLSDDFFIVGNTKDLSKLKSLLELYKQYELIYRYNFLDHHKDKKDINTSWFNFYNVYRKENEQSLSTGIDFNYKWLLRKLKESGKEVRYYTREEREKIYHISTSQLRDKLLPFLTQMTTEISINKIIKELANKTHITVNTQILSMKDHKDIDDLLYADFRDSTNFLMRSGIFINISFDDKNHRYEYMSADVKIVNNVLDNIKKVYLPKLKPFIDDLLFDWENDEDTYCGFVDFIVNYNRLE